VLSDRETATLVLRARRGDAAAFTALVRSFLRPAYTVALAVLGRPTDAEDTAQDAMVAAFEKLDECREPERFAAWLFSIARRHALNALDRRRLRDVPAEEPRERAAEAGEPQPGLRGRLLAALDRIGPEQREVVLLHDLEGWTHAEIGAALGCSEIMSRQHLFQARRALRGLLEEPARGVEVDRG
jgi:RNA polymerase sigma-70 factor, ECF subfamily